MPLKRQGLCLRNLWGRRKAPGVGKKPVRSRPAFRRDGSEKATKRRISFIFTVNAYDPLVHVYTGGAAVVNSADREGRSKTTPTVPGRYGRRPSLRREFVDGLGVIVLCRTNYCGGKGRVIWRVWKVL